MYIKSKIKLGPLSKNAFGDDHMKHLKGGDYYCAWGEKNLIANGSLGKCSCYCDSSTSYYDTSTGIQAYGDWIRATWDNEHT